MRTEPNGPPPNGGQAFEPIRPEPKPARMRPEEELAGPERYGPPIPTEIPLPCTGTRAEIGDGRRGDRPRSRLLPEDVEKSHTSRLDEVEGSDDERDAFVAWPRRVREMAVDGQDPVVR